MQRFFALLFVATWQQAQSTTSPVAKVISMLSDLQAKIIAEGEVAQKEYAQFTEWCEDQSRNLGFEIKTGNSDSESLKATVAQEEATSAALSAKVDELAARIATDTADLKAATHIRDYEAADFEAEEKELVETVDMLTRAIQIIAREMSSGASMLQAGNLAQALTALVQASVISTSDANHLNAFIQSSQKSSDADEDEEPGAPAAAEYKSHSGNIADTLEDLKEKADAQLDSLRKTEEENHNNFQVLQQALDDAIKFANKDMDEAKKAIANSAEKKSTAEGDLDVTSKELAADMATKETLHHDCMTAAEEFQTSTNSRGEELKTLAQAKKIIKEATGAALDQVSLLQMSRSSLASGEDLANFEAVRLIRDLARQQNSRALAQLAVRMTTVMRSGGADPFGKVKGLISDMISKLEAEAGADATKKAYCDKELKETSVKKAEKTNEIQKLTTRIDQQSAQSAKLKEEVGVLQLELAKLAKSQADMDRLRQEEHEDYTASKAEQTNGLEGVKLALKLLRDYYASDAAHNAATGAASGIIGLLEVCESDITKSLATMESNEEAAAADYEAMTKRNQLDRTTKGQDVKYKMKESKYLDKEAGENTADRSGVQAELDAVLEYLSKIEDECTERAESYADRKAHRDSEIAGLKQALSILESETALVQRLKKHRTLRGSSLHAASS